MNITATIEIQGTSLYNPLESYVKINQEVVYMGDFYGLQLTAVNRCNLKVEYSGIYDTFEDPTQASEMAKMIRSFNSNYLILVISSYAWEPYFNKDLSEAINEVGGYLTKSIVNMMPPTPSYKPSVPLVYGFPYAFIGVPGQSTITRQNFEILRNNTQYFNYNDTKYNAIPTARIRVNLIFDTYRQFYFLKNNRLVRINKT